jgi:hypothetical protein
MRLLHTKDFTFKEFIGENIPPYAIVSHRWSDEEVSHQDFLENRQSFLQGQCNGYGWLKIKKGCGIALSGGYDWLWVQLSLYPYLWDRMWADYVSQKDRHLLHRQEEQRRAR